MFFAGVTFYYHLCFASKYSLTIRICICVLVCWIEYSGVIRKSVATVLTVINQKEMGELRKFYATKKFKPLNLREKKTRAIRRRLTPAQASKLTSREAKRAQYFPLRKFAIKA